MTKDPYLTSPASKVSHSWLDSCIAGVKFRLGLTIVAFLVAGLLTALIFLLPLPHPWDEMRFAVLLSLVAGSMLTGAVMVWFKGSRLSKRRKEALDLAFTGLTDRSSRYSRTGRRYHGMIGRRRFDAYVTQVKEAHSAVSGGVYTGEHLEIVLDSDMQVRFKAGPFDQQLSRAGEYLKGNLTALKEESPEGVIAYVLDVDWGRWLMQDEQASRLLVEMLTPHGQVEIRNLSLWPGSAMLSLHRLNSADLNAENVSKLLSMLTDWVERLEGLPSPEQVAERSKWDKALRGERKLIFKMAIKFLVVFLLLISILVLGVIWLLIQN